MTIHEFAEQLKRQEKLTPLWEGFQALRTCDPKEIRELNYDGQWDWVVWPPVEEDFVPGP